MLNSNNIISPSPYHLALISDAQKIRRDYGPNLLETIFILSNISVVCFLGFLINNERLPLRYLITSAIYCALLLTRALETKITVHFIKNENLQIYTSPKASSNELIQKDTLPPSSSPPIAIFSDERHNYESNLLKLSSPNRFAKLLKNSTNLIPGIFCLLLGNDLFLYPTHLGLKVFPPHLLLISLITIILGVNLLLNTLQTIKIDLCTSPFEKVLIHNTINNSSLTLTPS